MNHGSLFSGIGGFDLAAEWMGWNNVFQVEWDEWCRKVLAKNFPESLRFGDIVEFNKQLKDGQIITDTDSQRSRQVRKDITNGKRWRKSDDNRQMGKNGQFENDRRLYLPRIDIITGGFPCQPFSHAGKRKGTDDSRYLWPEMLTTIRTLKPTYVVGENVAGLVSMEDGKTLERIFLDLENEGYTIESFIIPACGVGAWHRRDRIWIIAYSDRIRGSKYKARDVGKIQTPIMGCSKDVSDTNSQRPQRWNSRELQECSYKQSIGQGNSQNNRKYWEFEPDVGGMVTRLSPWMDGYWDREPEGVPRVTTGVKDRVNRLKGLGNAVVPQIAFEIFKAIESYDKRHNTF